MCSWLRSAAQLISEETFDYQSIAFDQLIDSVDSHLLSPSPVKKQQEQETLHSHTKRIRGSIVCALCYSVLITELHAIAPSTNRCYQSWWWVK